MCFLSELYPVVFYLFHQAVWLCVYCVNYWSWFEARDCCGLIGQPLGTLHNTSYSFWSFYYKRRSHWMAPLGNCVYVDQMI